MQLSYDLPCRLCRLVFTLTLICSWCIVAPVARSGEAPSMPAPVAAAAEVSAQKLDAIYQALAAAEKDIPRDTFDPAAVVTQLQRDPDKLFTWVRDQTFYVPYRGMLRGPRGVLMDRLGNSLDRSLLLAELLRSAGQTVRLAHASLTAEQAQGYAGKLRLPPEQRLPRDTRPTDQIVDDVVDRYAAPFHIDPNALRQSTRREVLEGEQVMEKIAQQSADQTAMIWAAVALAPPAQPSSPVAPLMDHWWVQRQVGGRWIDLDPLLPDAVPGRAPAAPDRTIDLDKPADALALSGADLQQLQVRVLVEQWESGKLSTTPVLSQVLRPVDLLDQRVVLRHMPMNWPGNFNPLADNDPVGDFKAAVLKQDTWLPVLNVGDRQIIQGSFTTAGVVDPKPNLDAMAGAGKGAVNAVSQAADAFGLGSGPSKPDTRLTAEWIEYQIITPGQAPRVIRRQIFDLVGPAARASANAVSVANDENAQFRRGLAMMGETEIVVLPCQVSPQFLEHLQTTAALANRTLLPTVLRQHLKDPAAALDDFGKLVPPPSRGWELALMRAQAGRLSGAMFIAQPNIFSFVRTLLPDANGGILAREGFDIVANDVSTLPGAKADPAAIRLAQGVADTSAESLLLQADHPDSAGVLLAASAGQGVHWQVIRRESDPSLHSAILSPDIAARLRQDLADGYVVYAPEKPVQVDGNSRFCWFRIDPVTGQTLGFNQDGFGASFAEYAIIITRVALNAYAMYRCLGAVEAARMDSRLRGLLGAACMLIGMFGMGGAIAGRAVSISGVMGLGKDVLSAFVATVFDMTKK